MLNHHEPVLAPQTTVKFHSIVDSNKNFNYNNSSNNSSCRSSRYMTRSKCQVTAAVSPTCSSQCAITTCSKTSDGSGCGGRPPFITTVTRGKFLPSKFDLLVEKSLYTFSSRPRAVGLAVTKHQCSLSGGPLKEHNANSIPPRGAHDYYNMMYDPHIYRGRATTSTAYPPPKNKFGETENENKLRSEGGGEANRPRKKRSSTVITASTSAPSNGLSRSGRYKITTRVTTKSKGLIKLVDRQHTHVQTEQYLEDLSADLTPEERDAVVQTEAIYDLPLNPRSSSSKTFVPLKSGVDAFTQVLPGELFSFEEEVQPVVEALVGKILQQAMLEIMEEEEIAALQEQQNRFLEKRKKEEKLLRQLQEEQRKITEEKERLREQLHQINISEELNSQDRVILDQAIRSASINQPNIPTSYLIELLPSVLNSLRQEGYLNDNEGDGEGLAPTWHSSSKAESETGDGPFTTESSGCVSADPEEPSKINITSEKQDEEEDYEQSESNNTDQRETTVSSATTQAEDTTEERTTTATSITEESQDMETNIPSDNASHSPISNNTIKLPSFERNDAITAIQG